MRVLLADDHTLLLEGLQNLLEAHDIEVAGVARDGREAVAQARSLRPDVVLMDIRMPVCDGLTATRTIKAEMPDVKVVILSTSTDDQDLFEAVKCGASGYLLKSMDAETLIEALHDAQNDIPPFSPSLAAKVLAEFARTASVPRTSAPAPMSSGSVGDPARAGLRSATAIGRGAAKEVLTSRQREVLELVAQGRSYKEVGLQIHLSPRTVKYHMAETMRKLHFENRAQVLTFAGGALLRGEAGDEA